MPRTIPIRFAAFASCFVLSVVTPAQQVRQQPLGFVFDGGISRVRPLLGVPGAAVVGNPIDLGADISSSAASPNQDYVLVLSGPTRIAGLWTNGAKTVQVLPDVRPGATRVVLSPEGSSAVFYYPDTSRVHVVTGLPSAPVGGLDADLSSLMNPLKSLAVSDDGALLMASESFVDGNAAPAVVVFGAAGVVSRIATIGPASAIAFLSKSHDVLISAVSEAILIRDAGAQSSRILLPTAANSAAAVIASTDGTRAFFARTQAGAVSIVSFASAGAPADIVSCDCTPTGLSRTTSPSIYRLTEDSGAPISLLDVSSSHPRLLLIPPVVNTPPDNQ